MAITTRQCLLKLNIKEILFFLKYSFQREECISQLQVCLFDRNPEEGEHPSIYTDSFLSIAHYLPWRRERGVGRVISERRKRHASGEGSARPQCGDKSTGERSSA